MTELPVACSLTAGEAQARGAEFRELAARALTGRSRTERSLTLRFRPDPDVVAQVESLARRERECCPFLEIGVERGRDTVAVTLTAAPADAAALDVFEEVAAGAAPA